MSRLLILTDLEAKGVIFLITASRKQTLKALFYVTYCFFPSKKIELFCICKDLILEIRSSK